MFGIINYETFLIAAILLNVTPGSDTLYILGQSIGNGKKAGILSALGISTGAIIHIVLATFGLSVILAESVLAFNIVKYCGAAYLIFLGIKSLRVRKPSLPVKDSTILEKSSDKKTFVSGILTNLFNPKVALFFLAFLPQFINVNYHNTTVSFFLLGITFLCTGTIWCIILALYASKLSSKFRQNPKIKVWLDRFSGTAFIALGIKLALLKR